MEGECSEVAGTVEAAMVAAMREERSAASAEAGVPDLDSGKRTLGTSTGRLGVSLVGPRVAVVEAMKVEEAMAAVAKREKEALPTLHQDDVRPFSTRSQTGNCNRERERKKTKTLVVG